MRTKATIINLFSSIFLQLLNGISGLIIPGLLIRTYGSEINGMVSSATQFLSYISFLEAGLSGVVMSQLYKPLASNDVQTLNGKLADTRNFFRKIAIIFIIYTLSLSILYPLFIKSEQSSIYIGTLIIILSISFLFQYLFGIVSSILLQADQKGYIYSFLQSIVVALTIILTVIAVKLGASIHVLKIFTVLAALINPIGLYIYVKKKYPSINTKIKGNSKNLSGKMDGMIHHVCYFFQTNIDIMILSIVNLKLVSVYTVYHMIMMLIRRVFESFILSFRSGLGDLFVRGEREKVNSIFSMLEFTVYSLSAICFSVLTVLLFPFIGLYIGDVDDIQYVNIPFGIVMIIAELAYTIRIPYHAMVNSTGVFKETKGMAIEEAVINLVISAIVVYKYGIVGVAVGTALSCIYRTIRYYMFFHKNILYLEWRKIILRLFAMISSLSLNLVIFTRINLECSSYIRWFLSGMLYLLISCVITMSIFILLFKKDFKELIYYGKNVFHNRKS